MTQDQMMELDSDKWHPATEVTLVEKFAVISLRGNNWKLFRFCDVKPCNITNYFIRGESERYAVIKVMI